MITFARFLSPSSDINMTLIKFVGVYEVDVINFRFMKDTKVKSW